MFVLTLNGGILLQPTHKLSWG